MKQSTYAYLTAGQISSSSHKRDVHADTYSNECPPQGSVSKDINYEVSSFQ